MTLHFSKLLYSVQNPRRFQKSSSFQQTLHTLLQDLPVELIQHIFQFIDPPGLCHLAMTCWDIHFIALHSCFRRFGLRDVSEEIHVNSSNTDVLPALRLALTLTSVKRFVWQASGTETWVNEVKQIKRILSKLQFVGKMELDFSNGTNFGWTEKDAKMMNKKMARPWIKICTGFLHLAAQKSRSLELRNHILSTRGQETAKDALRFRSFGVRCLSAAFEDIPLSSCFRLCNGPPFPKYIVNELILSDSSLLRNPSFSEWSFKWINNMPIERLVMSQGDTRLPLLNHIHLSSTLNDFTLHHQTHASDDDIEDFLRRHPGLTTCLRLG